MCMWQSQAFGGAFSFGGAVPTELGTCCACADVEIALDAVNAAAPVRKLRRSMPDWGVSKSELIVTGRPPCLAIVVAQTARAKRRDPIMGAAVRLSCR